MASLDGRNYLRWALARPWRTPGDAIGLAGQLAGALTRRLTARASGDVHRGTKQRPAWLPPLRGCIEPGRALHFPVYTVPDGPRVSLPPQQFLDGDPEAHLAAHRWAACAAAIVEDADAAHRAVQASLTWLSQPPDRVSSAWEPYSTVERVANLLLLLSARPITRPLVPDILLRTCLSDAIVWIDDHLEHYGPDRTNNHLLNNARGLVMAGSVLGMTGAVEQGLAIAARMGSVLYQPGGFLRERSAHYQLVTTQWLLDTAHFAGTVENLSTGAQRDADTVAALSDRASAATSRLLGYFTGTGAWIGDLSPDRSPEASAALLQALYPGRVRPEPPEPGIHLCDDWVLAARGTDTVVSCVPVVTPARWPTHGHADTGHLVWRAGGVDILSDAGRASYVPGDPGDPQRGWHGHNVISVNGLGAEAGAVCPACHWWPAPYSTMHTTVAGEAADALVITHDGFRRVAGAGPHTRRIEWIDHGLRIVDHVEGHGPATLEVAWVFAPEWRQESDRTLRRGDLRLTCHLTDASGTALPVAWQSYQQSRRYGERRDAVRLCGRTDVSLPGSVITTMTVQVCAE